MFAFSPIEDLTGFPLIGAQCLKFNPWTKTKIKQTHAIEGEGAVELPSNSLTFFVLLLLVGELINVGVTDLSKDFISLNQGWVAADFTAGSQSMRNACGCVHCSM